MNNIIGRKTEIIRLTEYVNSGKAKLVAIYGRCRVGKTLLIRRFVLFRKIAC